MDCSCNAIDERRNLLGYTNAYSTDVNTLTVKILGIPIYELTKSGTEYIGKSIGVYMGAVCGICMALQCYC